MMYHRIYILRKNGQIDEFTSPDSMDDALDIAAVHSVPAVAMETIKADDREVCIAREM